MKVFFSTILTLCVVVSSLEVTQASLPSNWCRNGNGDPVPDGWTGNDPTHGNYCNTCTCKDGNYACTKRACLACEDTKTCDDVKCTVPGSICTMEITYDGQTPQCPMPVCKTPCQHGKKLIKPGYSLPGYKRDWCNTCTCDANGSGEVSCTEKACPPREEGCALPKCTAPPLNCQRVNTGWMKDGCPKNLCDLKCKPKLDKGCGYDSCEACGHDEICVRDPLVQCLQAPCCETRCEKCPEYSLLVPPLNCKYVFKTNKVGCPIPELKCKHLSKKDCPMHECHECSDKERCIPDLSIQCVTEPCCFPKCAPPCKGCKKCKKYPGSKCMKRKELDADFCPIVDCVME